MEKKDLTLDRADPIVLPIISPEIGEWYVRRMRHLANTTSIQLAAVILFVALLTHL